MSAPPLDRRTAWFAVFCGLLTLAVFIGFSILPQVRAAIASGCGAATSVSEFQMARTADDLIAVFSAPNGQCRAPMIAAMDAADRLDLFIFIAVYAAFLAAVVVLFADGWKSMLARAALAALAIGVVGDVIETATQLAITPRIDAPGDLLTWLRIGAWTKYGGLALNATLIGVLLFQRPWPNWIFGALGVLTIPATFLAYGDPPAYARFMGLAFGVFWLALLVRSFSAALRGRALKGEVVAD